MNISTSRAARFSRLLTVTLLLTSVGMATYEVAKTFALPNLTMWQSHAITIVFTTCLAAVVTYGVFRKLTALTRQKQAQWLQAEEIVSQATEGILTISKRGLVLAVNPAAEQLFGYRLAEVRNQPVTMLIADPPSPASQKVLLDSLPVGTILGLAAGAREMIGKHKNGESFPVELTASSVTFGDESVSVVFARNVSKRKQAQRYLTAHYAATCILAEANSLAEALPRILQAICEALRCEAGAFWRLDREAGVLCCDEVHQAPFAALPKVPDIGPLTCKSGQGLAGRVWSSGKPSWVENLLSPEDGPCWAVAAPLQLHGAFAFPILLGQELCGVMTFFSARKLRKDEQLLGIMAELGKQIGQFIARKHHQEKLRQSEERFRQLAENIHEVFWMADATDGRILYLSPSYDEVWGPSCPSQPTHLQSFLDAVHAEDRARVAAALAEQRRGTNTSEEYRIVGPDGTIRWVWDRAFPVQDGKGQVYRIAGLTADITNRRRTEEVLRQTTQTLQALVQAAPMAIHIMDLEGKVRLWNPAAERIFGWTAAEVLGQQLPLLPIEEHAGRTSSTFLSPQGGNCHGLATRCRRKDGTVIELSLSTAPLLDTTGNVFGAMGILVDLTEQKLLEDQLRQSQKMEAVGQLAGGVAHDFNNLLTIITGYSEMLLGDLQPGDTGQEYLEQIRQAGEQAASLTRQLLAFGRKQILQVRILNPNAVITNVAKMLRRLIGEDVEMILQLDPQLHCIKADPGQIEQILMNLATNARDAMPDGGTLTLATSNVQLTSARHSLPPDTTPGPYVMLAVRDTGCGMDPVTRARIFEPFFTTKEMGKGTGLGLATVYGIVKQSGGHIDVDSAPGRGTTFRIYLPRLPEPDRRADEAECLADLPRGVETVLLVEDEDSVRRLIHHALQLSGYTVLEAGSGLEALQLCEDHRGTIHLLLTDVIMPHMNGRQLAERAVALRDDLKVLYISGYTDRILDDKGILAPGIAFLEKPIVPGTLARKVREVLDAFPHSDRSAGVLCGCSGGVA